jgi:hypothetical protein
MPDLSGEEVRSLAGSLGLAVAPEDLGEVTHRLNAFLDALAPLASLPLEQAEPVPVPPERDAP